MFLRLAHAFFHLSICSFTLHEYTFIDPLFVEVIFFLFFVSEGRGGVAASGND